ncbi:hypothetical protein HK405_010614, partial [Cladochytrium tenue]
MFGGANKATVCFQTIQVRNAANTSAEVTAHIVDFCPTSGCLWSSDALSYNLDIYGEHTWLALGGGLLDGTVSLEIQVKMVADGQLIQ